MMKAFFHRLVIIVAVILAIVWPWIPLSAVGFPGSASVMALTYDMVLCCILIDCL